MFVAVNQTPSNYMKSIFHGKRNRQFSMQNPADGDLDLYNTDVAKAIRSSDVDLLREYLEEGKSFEGCNRGGESHLHLACRRADYETVEFLILEANLDTSVLDCLGRTVLHDLCWRAAPDFEIMELMINHANPGLLVTDDVRGHSCFEYCRKEDYEAWCHFLFKYSKLIGRRGKLAGISGFERR